MGRRICHRSDGNQKDIVDALRALGCFVVSLSKIGNGCPDLIVSYRGRLHWAEVKNGSMLGWKLTDDQKKFHALCGAPIAILDSVESAVAWIESLNVRRGTKVA